MQQQVDRAHEEMETVKRSYEQQVSLVLRLCSILSRTLQLSIMTEHMMSLNQQLAERQDELNILKKVPPVKSSPFAKPRK
jgi:hypothetical protein